eukprot:jgi/Mesvir1/10493/Mv25524-RA.1
MSRSWALRAAVAVEVEARRVEVDRGDGGANVRELSSQLACLPLPPHLWQGGCCSKGFLTGGCGRHLASVAKVGGALAGSSDFSVGAPEEGAEGEALEPGAIHAGNFWEILGGVGRLATWPAAVVVGDEVRAQVYKRGVRAEKHVFHEGSCWAASPEAICVDVKGDLVPVRLGRYHMSLPHVLALLASLAGLDIDLRCTGPPLRPEHVRRPPQGRP